jgi:hypothetical protein
VEHVNREVERQAEAALAAVERLEDGPGGPSSAPEPKPETEAGPRAEHGPDVKPERRADRDAHAAGTDAEGGTAEGSDIGAWPPADSSERRGGRDRDRPEDDEEEVDPSDVLSRVRDAL